MAIILLIRLAANYLPVIYPTLNAFRSYNNGHLHGVVATASSFRVGGSNQTWPGPTSDPNYGIPLASLPDLGGKGQC